MENSKHTPAPWRVFTEETHDGENVYPKLMTADYSKEIFPYGGGANKEFANCDFIVKCVNGYNELLEAATDYLELSGREKLSAKCRLEAAIKKAKGK